MKTKTCTKCNRTFRATTIEGLHKHFNWRNKSQLKLNPVCKDCYNKAMRAKTQAKKGYKIPSFNELTKHFSEKPEDNRVYVPIIENKHEDVIMFTKSELETLLHNLAQSGADAIGVPIKLK